jgi:hypothetical protein
MWGSITPKKTPNSTKNATIAAIVVPQMAKPSDATMPIHATVKSVVAFTCSAALRIRQRPGKVSSPEMPARIATVATLNPSSSKTATLWKISEVIAANVRTMASVRYISR